MSRKVDSKDFEVVKSIPISNENNNILSGIELVTRVVQQVPSEVWKEGAIALFNQFNKHLDDEREGKKKIRDTRNELLYLEIKDLIENIRKEENGEEFNQERINKWYERLDRKEVELKEMQNDADGLAKGLLKLTKQFIAKRFE